jgi:hypothetical protein
MQEHKYFIEELTAYLKKSAEANDRNKEPSCEKP